MTKAQTAVDHDHFAELRATLARREKEAQEREAQIAEMETSFAELRASAAQLESQRESQIAQRESQIAQHESQIAQMERNFALRESQFAEELQSTRRLLVMSDERADERARSLFAEQQRGFQESLTAVRALASDEISRRNVDVSQVLTSVADLREKLVDQLTTHATRQRERESEVLLREAEAQKMSLSVELARTADELSRAAGDRARLEEELMRLTAEHDKLRCRNDVKGIEGEQLVYDLLRAREEFQAWSFTDTSSLAGHSDFHMVCPASGRVVAVEVKNKERITLQDLEKSARDVRELRERLGAGRLVAYVFVSIRTRNIPHKGPLAMETRDDVPMLFYGASDAEELRQAAGELAKLVRISAVLGAGLHEKASDSERHERVLRRARGYIEQLTRQRKSLASMNGAVVALRKSIAELSADMEAMAQDMEDALSVECRHAGSVAEGAPQDSAAEGAPPESAAKPVMKPQMQGATQDCPACKRTFRKLSAHLAASAKCRDQL